jgi:hypothetical protein
MKSRGRSGAIGLILLLCGFAVVLQAQDNWMRVTIVHVKPDMIGRWRDLYKNKIVPRYKKAGIPYFSVWRTVAFGNGYEFTIMAPMKNFAQFDGETPLSSGIRTPARRRAETELEKCIYEAENFALLALPDISSGTAGRLPPSLMIVQTVTVTPKNLSAYLKFLREDMKPVVEKAGVERWQVYRHVFGSSTNQVTTLRSLKNYAELDMGPLASRILSPAEAGALAGKDNQLVESSRIVIAEYESELSYQ